MSRRDSAHRILPIASGWQLLRWPRREASGRLRDFVMHGVVAVHVGYWRAGSRGNAAVNVLASAELSNIGRAPTFNDIAVEVAPA
jgi:hypothetical protein